MFTNRIQAGILLADKLKKYKNSDAIVLGITRGGIPVAYSVANELGLPLDVFLAKKIGHPLDKEFAIGAVGLTDVIITKHENVSDEYIKEEIESTRNTLRKMQENYMGNKPCTNLNNKTVILIDDGIATGNTMLGSVAIIKKSKPHEIIIATPVASKSAAEKLKKQVNEFISLLYPIEFLAVGSYYEDFSQVDDSDVIKYLKK